MINGNMVGASMLTPKSLVLEDDNGNSFVGVIVGEETVLTAQASDIKIGKIAATDDGITEGTDTKTYHTVEGTKLIASGRDIVLPTPHYDYSKLQAIICSFDTNLAQSVSAEKVAINNQVYSVLSTDSLSIIQKNDESSCIDFGLVNTSDSMCVIRYITYKEI